MFYLLADTNMGPSYERWYYGVFVLVGSILNVPKVAHPRVEELYRKIVKQEVSEIAQ